MAADYFMYISFIINHYRHNEPIPAFLEQIAHNTHPQLFFVITTCIITFLFMYPVYKKSKSPIVSFFLYLGYPTLFFSHLSTVRQGMAVGFLFWALLIYKHTHAANIKKTLLITLSCLCHYSCVFGVLAFLKVEKIRKEILWTGMLLSLFLGKIFPKLLLGNLPGTYFNGKLSDYINMKAPGMTLVMILIYMTVLLIALFHNELVRRSNKNIRYINWIYIGVILFNLFSLNLHMAVRFFAMFSSTLLLLIPDIIKFFRIPKYVFAFMCIFVLSLNIWAGEKYNDGRHHFYPYITIFEVPAGERHFLHYYKR